MKIEISLEQFDVLNDVLWEIQENREYDGNNLVALNELKEIFSFKNYNAFRDKEN